MASSLEATYSCQPLSQRFSMIVATVLTPIRHLTRLLAVMCSLDCVNCWCIDVPNLA